MPTGPLGKKNVQLFGEDRIDLGGDFTGLMPGPKKPLSAQAIPEMGFMAPQEEAFNPLGLATPTDLSEPVDLSRAPRYQDAYQEPEVTGFDREQEQEERRRRAEAERLETLAIRELQAETAQDERKSVEFAQFYDRHNRVVGTPKGQVNVSDLHDPGRVPVEHLAYAASIFTKDKLLPSEREAGDMVLESYGWPVMGGTPMSMEPGLAMFAEKNTQVEELRKAREEVKTLYEKYPERKEQYNRTLYERLKQRVNDLKAPVHDVSTPEGKTLSKKRKRELKTLQPFFRVLDEQYKALGNAKKSFIEMVDAGPVPEIEPTERQLNLSEDLEKFKTFFYIKDAEQDALMRRGAAETDPGEPAMTPVTREGLEYVPSQVMLSSELVNLAKSEGIIDEDVEYLTMDMVEDNAEELQALAIKKNLQEVTGRIQEYQERELVRRPLAFPVEELSPEQFVLHSTETIPPQIWTYGLIAGAYRKDVEAQRKNIALARQYYDILIDSQDPPAIQAAQKGIQEIVKDATTYEKYVARGAAVIEAPVEEYKDKLLGVFSYFVPVPISWFKKNNEPWVYNHDGARVPVYPVTDKEYGELLKAYKGGISKPIKYLSVLSPELKGYASERWKSFEKNNFLNSGLDNTESTYQHLSDLMGERDIPASMKWLAISGTTEGRKGHLTATQLLQWLGNDNFDLANAPVLHAAKMRDVVQQLKDGKDISVIKSNLEAVGDIPAMVLHGAVGALAGTVTWAAKTGETLAKMAVVGPTEGSMKELSSELSSAHAHIHHFGISTLEYLADYTDPKHLKRRALYEMPMVLLDFSMIRSLLKTGMRVTAKGVHTVAEVKIRPGAEGAPFEAYTQPQLRPMYEAAPGTALVKGEGIGRRADPRVQSALSRQKQEAAAFKERSERRTYAEEHDATKFDNDGTKVFETGPAKDAKPKTKVTAEFVEHTNKEVGWLPRQDLPAIIKISDAVFSELAKRPDASGRLVAMFRLVGDYGGGSTRIIIENNSAQVVKTQLVAASQQKEIANLIATKEHVRFEDVQKATRMLTKQIVALSADRANFATNVIEYRLSYSPSKVRDAVGIYIKDWTPVVEGIGATPTRLPGEPPALADAARFEVKDFRTGEVLSDHASLDEARSAYADLRILDKTSTRNYALDEVIPHGVPENIQLQRIEAPVKKGVQLVDKETGETAFFSTNTSEVAMELKRLGEDFVDGAWTSNRYRRVLGTQPEGPDSYSIVNVKTGEVLQTLPDIDSANARLREIGFAGPVEFNVTGAELARVMGSDEVMAIVKEVLTFNANRTNLKLMRDPLNPDLGALGNRVTIFDTSGVPHTLDAVSLGLLKHKGNTFEPTPQLKLIARDKSFGDMVFEYNMRPALDMAEESYFLQDVFSRHQDGVMPFGVWSVKKTGPNYFSPDGGLSPTPGPAPPGTRPPSADGFDVKDTPEATIGDFARMEHEAAIKVLQESSTGEIYARLFEPQVEALVRRLKVKDRTPEQLAKMFGEQLGVKVVIGEPLTASDIRTNQIILRIIPPGSDITKADWDAWTLRLPSKDAWMGIEKSVELIPTAKAKAASDVPTQPSWKKFSGDVVAGRFYTGKIEVGQYDLMIRSPEDPPRSQGTRKDKAPHLTWKKKDLEDVKEQILSHLRSDVYPKTLNRITIELYDQPSSITFTSKPGQAIRELVEDGEIAWGYFSAPGDVDKTVAVYFQSNNFDAPKGFSEFVAPEGVAPAGGPVDDPWPTQIRQQPAKATDAVPVATAEDFLVKKGRYWYEGTDGIADTSTGAIHQVEIKGEKRFVTWSPFSFDLPNDKVWYEWTPERSVNFSKVSEPDLGTTADKKKDLIALLEKEAKKVSAPLEKASKNFEMVVVRQAMENISELIVNQMSPIARLDIKFTIEDGKVYPIINPNLAAKGAVRDALRSGQLKPGEPGLVKRIEDAQFPEQTAPSNPSKYSRSSAKDNADRPDKLLTFAEYKKKYPKNSLEQYKAVVTEGLDSGYYRDALGVDRTGIAIADRDFIAQVIESAGINIPPNMKAPIYGLVNTGGPIPYRRRVMEFKQALSSEEAFALGYEERSRYIHHDTMPYRYMAKAFGYQIQKGVFLFEYMADTTGRMRVRPKEIAQSMADILGERIVLEEKDANIGEAHPWLEENNPDKTGMVIVKDAKGKVITQERWLQALETADLKKIDVSAIETYRRVIDFIDVKDKPIGRMFHEAGNEEIAKIVKDGTAADLIEFARQEKFPSVKETLKKVAGRDYKENLKDPIVAVKHAFNKLTVEELTMWDVWRSTGEIPTLAEVYGSGENWVKAGLADAITDESGAVVGYKPTKLGAMAAMFNIGRRRNHYLSIPFLALTGDAATGMAPQLRGDFKKVIDSMPTNTEHQRGIKSILEAMNDLEGASTWLSDPIIAYQRDVLSFAGDLGMFPTDDAVMNAITYFRQVWVGALLEHGRAAAGYQALSKSNMRERSTANYTPAEIEQIELITGNSRLHFPIHLYAGWAQAELQTLIGFVRLIDKLIDDGLAISPRTASHRFTEKDGVFTLASKEGQTPGKGFEKLDVETYLKSGTFNSTKRWGKERPDDALENIQTFIRVTREKLKQENIPEAHIEAHINEIKSLALQDAENPIVQGLREKYGELYVTPQAKQILEVQSVSLSRWDTLSHKHSVETSPIRHLFFDNENNLIPKEEMIANAIEIYGEKVARMLVSDHDAQVQLRYGDRSEVVASVKHIINATPIVAANVLSFLAKASMELNSSAIQNWYKTNALFRSTVRGASRNLVGNAMLALSHHLSKYPLLPYENPLLDPVYFEAMEIFFSEGMAVVLEGVGGIPGTRTHKTRGPLDIVYDREAAPMTETVGGIEVESAKKSGLPKETEDWILEMISRNVFGNGPTAEVSRGEVSQVFAGMYRNPRTRVFNEEMREVIKELQVEIAYKVKNEFKDPDWLRVNGKSYTAKLTDEMIMQFVDRLMQQKGVKDLITEAIEKEGYNSVKDMVKGMAFDFPFNTKPGQALELLIKGLFTITDDFYRFNYAYWLWKRKGLAPHEIVREIGDFMPDFVRNPEAMHAARLINPWAFWPLKTVFNVTKFSYSQPVVAGLLRHVDSWLNALEQSEMSPEELYAHALRPNRERHGLLRTPLGTHSTSYSFYTGDMDTLFDPMSAEHLGFTGMFFDAVKILSSDAYKPRYGGEILMGDAFEKMAFAYWHYLQNYGPRLGWSPVGNVVNLGYEYMDKVHNGNIDIWDPQEKRASLRRALRFIGSGGTEYGGNVIQKIHDAFGDIEEDSFMLEAVLEDTYFSRPDKGTRARTNVANLLMEEIGGFDGAERRVGLQYIQEVLKTSNSARQAASILSKTKFPERHRQFLGAERIEELASDELRKGTLGFEYGPGFGQSLEKMPRAAAMKKVPSDETQAVLNLLRAFQINPGE